MNNFDLLDSIASTSEDTYYDDTYNNIIEVLQYTKCRYGGNDLNSSAYESHQELNAWLLIYWNTCYHDIYNSIPKQEYIELLLKIAIVLIDKIDIKYSYSIANLQFLEIISNNNKLIENIFLDELFKIADIYTDCYHPACYIWFLKNLYESITNTKPKKIKHNKKASINPHKSASVPNHSTQRGNSITLASSSKKPIVIDSVYCAESSSNFPNIFNINSGNQISEQLKAFTLKSSLVSPTNGSFYNDDLSPSPPKRKSILDFNEDKNEGTNLSKNSRVWKDTYEISYLPEKFALISRTNSNYIEKSKNKSYTKSYLKYFLINNEELPNLKNIAIVSDYEFKLNELNLKIQKIFSMSPDTLNNVNKIVYVNNLNLYSNGFDGSNDFVPQIIKLPFIKIDMIANELNIRSFQFLDIKALYDQKINETKANENFIVPEVYNIEEIPDVALQNTEYSVDSPLSTNFKRLFGFANNKSTKESSETNASISQINFYTDQNSKGNKVKVPTITVHESIENVNYLKNQLLSYSNDISNIKKVKKKLVTTDSPNENIINFSKSAPTSPFPNFNVTHGRSKASAQLEKILNKSRSTSTLPNMPVEFDSRNNVIATPLSTFGNHLRSLTLPNITNKIKPRIENIKLTSPQDNSLTHELTRFVTLTFSEIHKLFFRFEYYEFFDGKICLFREILLVFYTATIISEHFNTWCFNNKSQIRNFLKKIDVSDLVIAETYKVRDLPAEFYLGSPLEAIIPFEIIPKFARNLENGSNNWSFKIISAYLNEEFGIYPMITLYFLADTLNSHPHEHSYIWKKIDKNLHINSPQNSNMVTSPKIIKSKTTSNLTKPKTSSKSPSEFKMSGMKLLPISAALFSSENSQLQSYTSGGLLVNYPKKEYLSPSTISSPPPASEQILAHKKPHTKVQLNNKLKNSRIKQLLPLDALKSYKYVTTQSLPDDQYHGQLNYSDGDEESDN